MPRHPVDRRSRQRSDLPLEYLLPCLGCVVCLSPLPLISAHFAGKFRIEETGIEVDPHHTSTVSKRSDHPVGEVAQAWAEGTAVGVAGNERPFRDFADVVERRIREVGDGDHHL